jgi:hypothetical protein
MQAVGHNNTLRQRLNINKPENGLQTETSKKE